MSDQAAVHEYRPRGAAIDVMNCRDPEVLLVGPAGTGKAQPLDAPIWTPSGARPMGSVEPGDLVLGVDGQPVKVVDIPFRGVADVYRITFSDGVTVECSGGHLWDVSWRDASERVHNEVLSLNAIMAMGITKRHGTRPRFWIPQTQPVGFDPQAVPISPYILGALLGDGHMRPGDLSLTTADPEIAERLAQQLPARYKLVPQGKAGNAALAYRIVGDGFRPRRPSRAKTGYISKTGSGKFMARQRGDVYLGSFDTREQAQDAIDAVAGTAFTAEEIAGDSIHAELDRLGLRNARSASKFVPDVYKLNTAEVRWEVLRGLMDTDGFAEKSTISFTSVSERLARDVLWLVQSLGGTGRIATKQPKNGQLAYTVWIRLADPSQAFHLSRKRARVQGRQVPVRRWIESIDYVGERECQCITVDSPDGLYLADGFVVTHNSRVCLEKMHFMSLKNPGMRSLMLRKTLASLTSTGLVTFQEHVAAEAIAAGDMKWFGGSQKKPPAWEYSNGSVIVVGGMNDPQKVMSSEYDLIFVQEAVELDDDEWEKCTTRLRNGKVSFQQLLADCNPDAPTHWLRLRCDKGLTTEFLSRHEDNPVYFNEDGSMTEKGRSYMATLDRLTGVRHLRLRKGLWVAAEGVIYEDFDPKHHIVDRFDIPANWARFITVDFGYVHPFVAQWWAVDGDGKAYLYREIFHTKRTVDQHARDMLRAVADLPAGLDEKTALPSQWIWREPKPRALICDHDAENRAVLDRDFGMGSIPATKGVTDGIQIVQARMRREGDGKARIFFMRDSVVTLDPELEAAKKPTSTIAEITSYVWHKPNGTTIKAKEIPVKDCDDGMDAMRYFAVEIDRSRPRVRSMGGR